jgi:hypothetical protein
LTFTDLKLDNREKRSCQPCTACCDGWLRANIYGAEVGPGKPCPHSSRGGCKIYETRPVEPCRTFVCAWATDGSLLPDWLRPNDCGAIIILNSDWRGENVIKAIPVGTRIPERTLDWLMGYAQAAKRSLIYSERVLKKGKFEGFKYLRFGPPGSHATPPATMG